MCVCTGWFKSPPTSWLVCGSKLLEFQSTTCQEDHRGFGQNLKYLSIPWTWWKNISVHIIIKHIDVYKHEKVTVINMVLMIVLSCVTVIYYFICYYGCYIGKE